MSPPFLLTLMLAFLAYTVFRAVFYFKSKRPRFGIAVTFISCIVTFEIVRLIMQMASGSA